MAHLQAPVAYLCEGQFWCPEHCDPSEGEIDDGFVAVVTEFDMLVGEGLAESVPGSVCHGCKKELA